MGYFYCCSTQEGSPNPTQEMIPSSLGALWSHTDHLPLLVFPASLLCI